MNRITVAAAQYPVDYLGSQQAFADKLAAWVAEAAEQGSQLLLFPEYAAMELCSLLDKATQADLRGQIHAMQSFLPWYLDTYQQLATQYQVTLVAGSFPVAVAADSFVNRCYVIHPDEKQYDFQDKQIMTRFEREIWLINPGLDTGIKVIDTAVGKVGISICYDSEFPLIARTQIESGADIILVPSTTETVSGYHRVRIGSQARALENQCYVVHAPLVGEAGWSPAVDMNQGCAGVYTPVDQGFPENGILRQGKLNEAAWVYATLDLAKMYAIREQGHVLNHQDWQRQYNL